MIKKLGFLISLTLFAKFANPAIGHPEEGECRPQIGNEPSWEMDPYIDPQPATPTEPDTPLWFERMREAGNTLSHKGITQVILIHGTFSGKDPLQLLPPYWEYSQKHHFFYRFVNLHLKTSPLYKIMEENLIFTSSYAKSCTAGLGMPCYRLKWHSGNSHIARANAAWNLLQLLAEKHIVPQKTLLVGHSHGGQVIALALQLLKGGEASQKVLQALQGLNYPIERLPQFKETLAHHPFSILTLGTPPRYCWPLKKGNQLVHIVHHTSHSPLADPYWAVFEKGKGDFIQQFGIAGSDCPHPPFSDDATRLLEEALGVGFEPRQWAHGIRNRVRTHNKGKNILVNLEESPTSPLNTVFGHGHYTMKKWAPLIFQIAALSLKD